MLKLTYFSSPPPFQVWTSHPQTQPELIITAGADGDEYAGQIAASQLITRFTQSPPPIPTLVIPILNLAGYTHHQDSNPLDGRFPKHIYPGHRFGSSSSQLMWRLSRHVQGARLWLDLHGGNQHEKLRPFIWADATGNTNLDNLTLTLLQSLSGRTLYSSRPSLAPTSSLRSQNTCYLLFESGELGLATQEMVSQHLRWVEQTLDAYLPIRNHSLATPSFTPTYRSLKYQAGPLNSNHPDWLWTSPTQTVLGLPT